MVEFPLGYREVVPDQTLPEKWKEITLNTGKRVLTSDRSSTARQTEISFVMSHKNASGNHSRRRASITLAE